MQSLRDIRRNITSVKATRQIMYTMKMVASARMKRAQNAIVASRPFAAKMENMVGSLHSELAKRDDLFCQSWVYDFCTTHKKSGTIGLVVITGDKGLCGAFNTALLRRCVAFISAHADKKIKIFAVGRKARDFMARLKTENLELTYELTGIFPKASYAHAELLGDKLIEQHKLHNFESVTIIGNEFKSMLAQEPRETEIIPLMHVQPQAKALSDDFLYEPGKAALMEALVPRYIKAQVYRRLLESQAAELAARMNAMESATKNASELIDTLTLKLNRSRQSIITNEITEIVGGAEALNS